MLAVLFLLGPLTEAYASSDPVAEYRALIARLEGLFFPEPAKVAQVIANGRPTLLGFLDRGCSSCLRMVPALEALQKEIGGEVNILVIDLDDLGKNPTVDLLAKQYKVWAGPQFVLFDKRGKMVGKLFGPKSREELIGRLRKLIAQ